MLLDHMYQEITVKETPSFYFHLLYNMCDHEGFLLFNQGIAVGSTTLHVKCCPGAEDSLANSFPNVWKAIADVGVGDGHHDHGTQNKLLPFLLTSGIKKKMQELEE